MIGPVVIVVFCSSRTKIQESWCKHTISALFPCFCTASPGFLTGSLSQPHFLSNKEEVVSGLCNKSTCSTNFPLPQDPLSVTGTLHKSEFASYSLVLAQTILFPSSPCSAPLFLVSNPYPSFLFRLCICRFLETLAGEDKPI